MASDKTQSGDFSFATNEALRLISLSRDWVAILNQRRQIIWANPTWATGLKIPLEQFVGRIFDDLVHPSETILPSFEPTDHTAAPHEFNLALRDASGDAILIHWRAVEQGNDWYFSGIRLQAPRFSDPYLATFERAPIGIVHIDIQGNWLRINQRYCELVGYSEAELRTMTFRNLTLPDDFPHFAELMTRLVTGESHYEEYEGIHIQKNGEPHWMHMTGTLVRDADGLPDYFMVTLESSQARKEMEAALHESQVRYRMVADYTYDWEYWQRPDGRFEYVSPSVERITGYLPVEFMVNPGLLAQIVVPEDRPKLHITSPIPPERLSYEFRLIHKSGEVRWIEHECVPIYADEHYVGRRASNRDITERKQTQAKIEEQQHLLESIFRAAPDYIYLTDLDLQQQVLSNRAKVGILEVSDQQLSLQQALSIMHPDDVAIWREHYENKDRPPDDSIYTCEFRINDGMGGWRWIRTREVVFRRHEDGSAHQILGISHDITAEKEQERALRDSEARFRNMFERHQAVKLLINPSTGQIVDANPAAAQFYGWDVATLRAMRIQDINTLPDEKVRREMQRAETEQRDFFNFQHRLANGDIRDVEVHSAPVEVGGRTLLYSIIMDVTALHQIERDLQESQRRFDAFMKNSPMAAYIKDLEGRLIYVNPVCAQIFGLVDGAWQNRNDLPLWGESATLGETDRQTLKMGMTSINEAQVRIGEENRIWLTYRFPIQDIQGRLFVGGMGVDVTDLKRAERQLMELALERERMQILGHFIEKAAHEFRTPLSVIELGLYSMRGLDTSEKHHARVQKMEEQIFYMVSLVESMVTMTRLDSTTHLETTRISLQSLVRGIQELFCRTYPQRADHFRVVMPETTLVVQGDAILLERAISELLTNAQHFTPDEGQITLSVALEDQRLVVTVEDNGVGINPAHLPHIFEHFFRADVAHTTRGFGLGLSIVKRIVELHGGEIQVESTPGMGTVFSIVLPSGD